DDDGYERLATRLAVEAPALTVLTLEAAKAAEAPRLRLLPLIRRAFRSPDAAFRRWACEAAGDAGGDGASLLPHVRELLKDPDRLVRLWARIAEAKLDAETPAIELVGAEGKP
ncbi:MAG TPA: hypothetical protein VMT52_08390, partial [Planctomycetota bacterium]|nr:hypothetical protein [Planctomycetota bacterium]